MGRPRLESKLSTIQLNSRTIATDWILELPEDRSTLQKAWTLDVTEGRMDYLVRDVHHGLKGNTIKISLNIEYMPIVGPFFKVLPPVARPAFTKRPT